MALVHVSSLTFGWLCRDKARPVRGARSSRRLVQTSRIGASTERHGGEIRHPRGTPPRSGRRKARPSNPVETPGANEVEARPTGPRTLPGADGRADYAGCAGIPDRTEPRHALAGGSRTPGTGRGPASHS